MSYTAHRQWPGCDETLYIESVTGMRTENIGSIIKSDIWVATDVNPFKRPLEKHEIRALERRLKREARKGEWLISRGRQPIHGN